MLLLKFDVSFNNIILLQIVSTDGSIPIYKNNGNSNEPQQIPALTAVVNMKCSPPDESHV